MGSGSGQTYKVKLPSGRILGPLTLERVRLLILKNQIIGLETAREYPDGDWQDINLITPIAELLVAHAQGKLEEKIAHKGHDGVLITQTAVLPGATQIVSDFQLSELPEVLELKTQTKMEPDDSSEEKTQMFSEHSNPVKLETETEDKTYAEKFEKVDQRQLELEGLDENVESLDLMSDFDEPLRSSIANERTVVFQRSSEGKNLPGKKKKGFRDLVKNILLGIVLGVLGYNLLLSEPEKPRVVRAEPIRPKLPEYVQGKSDPNKSVQIYGEAMKFYVADTVTGYRIAADKLRQSAAYDITNVKALAMLASAYINLIDSSNKDENYFSVLSKLIEMSRAKAVDLPETVIADVEFYIIINKPEAAQNRIVEYTKSHPNYGTEMFYYLALSFFSRGDIPLAARYLNQFPDNKAFSAKIFYLRGQIAEKLKDTDAAMMSYAAAVKFNPNHAKSRLRIAAILNSKGALKEGGEHLEFVLNHTDLLAPKDLGLAYYLHAQLAELYQKWDLALGDVERATKLEPENHDYLLELYTLRAKAGDTLQAVQKQARMYYFLGEGEKLIQQGKYQEALVPLLQARQANDESPLPLVKIGDMFNYLHDVENAKNNYKMAANRASNNIQIWSKYIQSLIQSYEWEEASKAMDRFRKLPVSQSSIDKAAADMYQKQGRFVEAQTFYRKAMRRDIIDPDVYIAYAKSLMSTKNFKDAPFFFALGLRFDPLNVDAIINTAKCVAETESIDRAINSLQDELNRSSGARAEYLSAIAEFQIQKGAWDQAQQSIEQAMKADPNYAYAWKLQAQVFMNREGLDKTALDSALASYKSFSERNASDPSGYLERYKIFIKKAEFEKAREELNRIYEIYPKYPNLHYYLGMLYSVQGNHKVAAEELKRELLNNPNNPQNLVSYGKELLDIGQPQDALNQFTQAMRLAPQSSDAKQNAGWANYQIKNFQAAVALIRAALVIDKANPTLYKRLGIVYRDMGDRAGACGSFKKYLEMEPDAPDKAQFQECL